MPGGEKNELLQALAKGRAAWPTVAFDERELAAFLTVAEVSPSAVRQHGADLFLAAACAAGIPEALACFDAKFLSQVDRYVRRMRLAPDVVDEIRQQLRIRMIGPEAKIRRYTGLASLDRWLRLACVRLALDIIESEARHTRSDQADEMLARVAASDNPEFDAIRGRYAPLIQQEIRKAIERLSDRDKTILRLHFVEGLNVEGLGVIYRVHRATVARWIVAIRNRLLEDVRQHLHLQVGATSSQLASMVRHVQHELALSLTRLLSP